MKDPDDHDTAEMFEAEGIVVTVVFCPECGLKFRRLGNCDREIVECPGCDAELRITCK